MTDAAIPDNRCERCSSRGVRVEWDDDDRKYVRKCALCGRVQGSVPAAKEETEMDGKETKEPKFRDWSPKAKPSNGAAAAAPSVKPDSAAAKALESYHVATTRYLEASEQLRADEQRAAEAQARAKATAERLVSFRAQMAEARAKLDQELAIIGPTGEPKPFRERVKVREGGEPAKRHERTCEVCGTTFQAAMPTAKYCSERCRNQRATEIRRGEPAAEVEISPEAMLIAAAMTVEASA